MKKIALKWKVSRVGLLAAGLVLLGSLPQMACQPPYEYPDEKELGSTLPAVLPQAAPEAMQQMENVVG